jgi:hypothetical protein
MTIDLSILNGDRKGDIRGTIVVPLGSLLYLQLREGFSALTITTTSIGTFAGVRVLTPSLFRACPGGSPEDFTVSLSEFFTSQSLKNWGLETSQFIDRMLMVSPLQRISVDNVYVSTV